MNEPGGALEQRNHRPKILATIGVAGAIVMLGAGAITFLTHASPEALAATWWAGITTGLIGLVVMIYVAAARLGARDERGPGSGPGPAAPMDDVDAELFRILADARLGDISTRRRSRPGPRDRGRLMVTETLTTNTRPTAAAGSGGASMVHATEVAGFIGAGLAGAAYVPQISHLIRARCSAGISLFAFAIWLVASLLVTSHAIAIRASVFISLGVIQVIATTLICIYTKIYEKSYCDIHRAAVPGSPPPVRPLSASTPPIPFGRPTKGSKR